MKLKLTMLTVAIAVFGLGTNSAEAHLLRLPDHPKKNHLENRLIQQTENYKHAKYVCNNGKGKHKKWACKAVIWIAKERKETQAALAPKIYTGGTPAQNVALGRIMAASYGWTGYEWEALYALWNHESGWSQYANNPTSDACGIPQRMNDCAEGHDPRVQIAWGLKYIKGRYGSPSAALAHLRTHNYY